MVTTQDNFEVFNQRQDSTSSTIHSISQTQGPENVTSNFEDRLDRQNRRGALSDSQSCDTVRNDHSTCLSEKIH